MVVSLSFLFISKIRLEGGFFSNDPPVTFRPVLQLVYGQQDDTVWIALFSTVSNISFMITLVRAANREGKERQIFFLQRKP